MLICVCAAEKAERGVVIEARRNRRKIACYYEPRNIENEGETNYMATVQDGIIGTHPAAPDFIGVWLSHTDNPTTAEKKHRVLEENAGTRAQAVDEVAKWVFSHLVSDFMREQLHEKRQILSQYDFKKVVEQYSLLPETDTTIKGVVTEVILVEYLKKTTGYTPIIYKLQFNPNTDQSMKGDDCLLFDPADIKKKVIYGESKYRGIPNESVVKEIVGNLQENKKLPVSLTFVANVLANANDKEKAKEVLEVLSLIKEGKTPVHNAGFLLSLKSGRPSQDTTSVVEKHMSTTNPNLVFISLGVDNPEGLVYDVMDKVKDMMNSI